MTFISQTSFPGAPANTVLSGVPCDASVYVGAAVYMDSGGTAYNALADDLTTSNVIGVVVAKAGATVCTIRFLGLTEGEIFSSLDVTKEYYLSDTVPGSITTTPPTASGHVLLRIGQPYSDKRLLVNKGTMIKRA